jgi:hypothetical protein
MESSGFFEAGYKFLSVEEIILYKIVSDTPKKKPEIEKIPSLIKKHLHIIEKLIEDKKDNFFIEIEAILKDKNLTKTQYETLKKILIYYKIKNKPLPKIPDFKNKKEAREFISSLTS